jgi:CDP-glucose 4,6-dehydratase
MENLVIDPAFWRGRRVFLTGHTGFKGAWTALLLRKLGSEIFTFALPPENNDQLFVGAGVSCDVHHCIGDVRDLSALRQAIGEARPEIVIHMAAQSLVRLSYQQPVETYSTNVMGTVHLLEAVRSVSCVRAVVVVTSDKCYENRDWVWGYRETDRLGGHDPYSNSKGCAELVTGAFRSSFFQHKGAPGIATARAGNVIGGGDWAQDRLVPDIMRAFIAGKPVRIRYPHAVRPWQHVLDPVIAYLVLAERLFSGGIDFAGAWNFGPPAASEVSVQAVVEKLVECWGDTARWEIDEGFRPHEAAYLSLDCAKAAARLHWRPAIDLDDALTLTVEWYRTFQNKGDMRELSHDQVERVLGGKLGGLQWRVSENAPTI